MPCNILKISDMPFKNINSFAPFFFLVVLAGLSFWLNEMVRFSPDAAPPEHKPDAFAYDLQMLQFGKDGVLRYRLNSPEMRHFPDDDSAEMDDPVLIAYRDNEPPITVVGKNAVVTSDGDLVYLYNGTKISRPPFEDRGALRAEMEHLVVEPNADFAFTNTDFVLYENDDSWVKSIGAKLFIDRSVIELQSRVTAFIQPQLMEKKK